MIQDDSLRKEMRWQDIVKGVQAGESRDLAFSASFYLVSVGPWARHVTSLTLSFLICKMRQCSSPLSVAGGTNPDGCKH